MSNWGQLRLLLQASAGKLSADLIDGYLNTRYADILDRYPWKGLEVETTLQTTAAYQTGTVNVTLGSAAVVGTGTTFTTAMTGMRFRLRGDVAIYTFTFVDATHGTLDRNYEGVSNAAATFWIYQDEYVLPAATKTIISMVSPVTGLPLVDFTKGQVLAEGGGYSGLPSCPGAVTGYAPAADTNENTPPVYHTVQLFPPPLLSQGYPLRIRKATAGWDGSSTSSAPLPWVSDNALLCGCRADIKHELEDYSGAELQEGKYEKAIAAMIKADVLRRGTAQPVTAPQWSGYRLRRVLR